MPHAEDLALFSGIPEEFREGSLRTLERFVATGERFPPFGPRTWPWMRDGVLSGRSTIAGTGLFTSRRIPVGTRVIVWSGRFFNESWATSRFVNPRSVIQVDDETYYGNYLNETTPDEYLNHSCDGNLWFEGDAPFFLSARRDIPAESELTMDYALLGSTTEDWIDPVACGCGTASCRGRVTSKDWRCPELQTRYAGHWPAFLARRMSGAVMQPTVKELAKAMGSTTC